MLATGESLGLTVPPLARRQFRRQLSNHPPLGAAKDARRPKESNAAHPVAALGIDVRPAAADGLLQIERILFLGPAAIFVREAFVELLRVAANVWCSANRRSLAIPDNVFAPVLFPSNPGPSRADGKSAPASRRRLKHAASRRCNRLSCRRPFPCSSKISHRGTGASAVKARRLSQATWGFRARKFSATGGLRDARCRAPQILPALVVQSENSIDQPIWGATVGCLPVRMAGRDSSVPVEGRKRLPRRKNRG